MSLDRLVAPYDDGVPAERAAYESFTVWSTNGGGDRSGGDWCAILPVGEDAVALTIGDVAGHGTGSTPRMGLIRAAILTALNETQVPSDVLAAANAIAFGGDAVIVTAIVAIFDRVRRTITFANAGHPPPLVSVGHDHAFLATAEADLPLGVYARHRAANYVVALPHDALFVLYTDGITEHARDPIRGEVELIEAARWAFERPELDAARAVSNQMLARVRGDDDAATLVMRLSRGFHGIHDTRSPADTVR